MRITPQHWKRTLIAALAIAAIAYAGVVGWFWLNEDSIVYLPRRGLRNADSLNIGIEQVTLLTPDSVQLVGWIIPSVKRDTSDVWLLYFHGNGGTISSRGYIEHYKAFRSMGANTFAVDYRGYGLSGGVPSEKGLYTDALAAFNYLVRNRRIAPKQIIVFGYSLGSAVAINLAVTVDIGGVIIEGAFMSLPIVGEQQYPFLPVMRMMRNRFESFNKIREVDEPKLIIHALHDEVIPIIHGEHLFAHARDPKTFVQTEGGHEDTHLVDSIRFYGSIGKFFDDVKRSNK